MWCRREEGVSKLGLKTKTLAQVPVQGWGHHTPMSIFLARALCLHYAGLYAFHCLLALRTSLCISLSTFSMHFTLYLPSACLYAFHSLSAVPVHASWHFTPYLACARFYACHCVLRLHASTHFTLHLPFFMPLCVASTRFTLDLPCARCTAYFPCACLYAFHCLLCLRMPLRTVFCSGPTHASMHFIVYSAHASMHVTV